MSADLSVTLSGALSSPQSAVSAADKAAFSGSQMPTIGRVTARIAPAVWPSPGALDLVSQLLDLSGTIITSTSTISRPETDADFWGMLAAALPTSEQD